MNKGLDRLRLPICVALCAVCPWGLPSCAGDPDATPEGLPPCLQASQENTDCAALYEPVFVEIFQRTLKTTCASSGVSCHGTDGRMGGLVFVDLSQSYDELLGQTGPQRVVPGDPACSELMVRLDSPGHDWSMPPGAPLDERARCAIRRWISAGATPPAGDGGS